MAEIESADLTGAKSLLARAQRHYGEFQHLADFRRIWSVNERQDSDGNWVYSISIAKDLLIRAGPVIADCANNIASSLDHVAAALAKARGHDRLDRLYFPWALKDEDFERRLEAVQDVLGPQAIQVIREVRKKHWHEVNHVHAAKQISRDGKHWELRAAIGSALGVQLVTKDLGTQLFQVPRNAFNDHSTYEFHRSRERLPLAKGWELVIGIRIDGLDEGLATSPDSIFPCAFRFVQAMIETVESRKDGAS